MLSQACAADFLQDVYKRQVLLSASDSQSPEKARSPLVEESATECAAAARVTVMLPLVLEAANSAAVSSSARRLPLVVERARRPPCTPESLSLIHI